MTDTVRQRIERASADFHKLEGVVFTTFCLATTFFEEHALPAALGVEAKTTAARRAEVHQRLGCTPCTVFYDPATAPRIGGRYRYVARPIPIRGRFFHPKLVTMAGSTEDGVTWVYLAVSSANLTLSGWGRNAESFGETWISTRRHQSWETLDKMLFWLQAQAPLGEEQAGMDATARVRAALNRMPDRSHPDGYDATLYSSVVNTDGLPAFLQMGRRRRPSQLWVYSPYWGEVAEHVTAFNARETILVPARRIDGAFGLSQEQAETVDVNTTTIRRNPSDIGDRFWHMKTYWILHGDRAFTAVGSCNFTHAGLTGIEGNVEAMLVFEADPDWLQSGDPIERNDLADETQSEEDVPQATPVAIVVAWDWRIRSWRWWLEAGPKQRDFVLNLPGLTAFATEPGTHLKQGSPPARGATYTVAYRTDDRQWAWHGQIVELNLDHSSRTYGRPLTANEILESWRGRAPTWDLGGSGGGGGGDGDPDDDDIEQEAAAAFETVNLYDFYRSMRALRTKLATLDLRQDIQRSYLVGRPDSVMAMAHLANRDGEAPVVRYLVLREICGVVSSWAALLDAELVALVRSMSDGARTRTHTQLLGEVGGDSGKADAMLDWFERQLGRLDKGFAP